MVPYYTTAILSSLFILVIPLNGVPQSSNQLIGDCPESSVAFELLTDYSILDFNKSADGALLQLHNSVSVSIDLCIDACRTSPACYALNYQHSTGACDLFKDRLTLSFSSPSAFSLKMQKDNDLETSYYAQKMCLSGTLKRCEGRSAAFNTTIGKEQLVIPSNDYPADDNIRKRIVLTATREICMELCLNEEDFHCSVAVFNADKSECAMIDALPDDFHLIADQFSNVPSTDNETGIFYFQANNCIKANFRKFNSEGDKRPKCSKNLGTFVPKMVLIYAGIGIQMIIFIAVAWACRIDRRNKDQFIDRGVHHTSDLQVLEMTASSYDATVDPVNGTGEVQLPTYWQAVWGERVLHSTVDKVMNDDDNDDPPPPTYLECYSNTNDSSLNNNNDKNQEVVPPYSLTSR